MSLESFVTSLHFDTDKARPPDWEVDWEDAPHKYKLYRGLPSVPLSSEVPLTLEDRSAPAPADLRNIGHFLWYVFGLAQVCHSVFPAESMQQTQGLLQGYRRFVPSGGGLYPSELYVYLKLADLPSGVYHYDVAHHRLVLLREGVFDSYVAGFLGDRCDVSACFGFAFVSTFFWKNYFKYNNFAYRLQGLDAGVLIGQLLEVAKRYGYAAGVYFQFLDRAVNHLLGISAQEETVYAVVPLSAEPTMTWFADHTVGNGMDSAAVLCRELAPLNHQYDIRSQTVLEYPMLVRMNEASLLESPRQFRLMDPGKNAHDAMESFALPMTERLSYNLAAACRKRYSPEADFVLGQVTQIQLASLLHDTAASSSYRNDLDGANVLSASRVSLYVCLYNVKGVPSGAYWYDSAAHALRQIRFGDLRSRLQLAMTSDNVNLFQVPLCFHVAGDKDHLITALGYRGYRIQQMEAGMLVQRLLLTSSALGMGGHPLLGYDVKLCDDIYNMASAAATGLIQIPVGCFQDRPWLAGSLHA